MITGTIMRGQDPVPEVVVQAKTVDFTYLAMSSPDGSYKILVPKDTLVNVSFFKIGGFLDSHVSSLDAAWIRQYVIGSRDLTRAQKRAADVTGNGQASSLDAARIIQFKTNQISDLPLKIMCNSDWIFYENESDPICGYSQSLTLDSNKEINVTGVLAGDVTENWTP